MKRGQLHARDTDHDYSSPVKRGKMTTTTTTEETVFHRKNNQTGDDSSCNTTATTATAIAQIKNEIEQGLKQPYTFSNSLLNVVESLNDCVSLVKEGKGSAMHNFQSFSGWGIPKQTCREEITLLEQQLVNKVEFLELDKMRIHDPQDEDCYEDFYFARLRFGSVLVHFEYVADWQGDHAWTFDVQLPPRIEQETQSGDHHLLLPQNQKLQRLVRYRISIEVDACVLQQVKHVLKVEACNDELFLKSLFQCIPFECYLPDQSHHKFAIHQDFRLSTDGFIRYIRYRGDKEGESSEQIILPHQSTTSKIQMDNLSEDILFEIMSFIERGHLFQLVISNKKLWNCFENHPRGFPFKLRRLCRKLIDLHQVEQQEEEEKKVEGNNSEQVLDPVIELIEELSKHAYFESLLIRQQEKYEEFIDTVDDGIVFKKLVFDKIVYEEEENRRDDYKTFCHARITIGDKVKLFLTAYDEEGCKTNWKLYWMKEMTSTVVTTAAHISNEKCLVMEQRRDEFCVRASKDVLSSLASELGFLEDFQKKTKTMARLLCLLIPDEWPVCVDDSTTIFLPEQN